MPSDIVLSLRDVQVSYRVTKSFSLKGHKGQQDKAKTVNAVRGVSFDVHAGEVVGLVGRNGAGKSTLLQAIAGLMDLDGGSIDTHGHKVSLMSLGTGFHNDLSGRENIILAGMLLGYTKAQVMERMDDIIEFSELEGFVDYPVRTYSSGMHSKLSFAITTILDNEIILIDEVLSVGDVYFKQKSYEKLKELILDKQHTVILVSHSLKKTLELCDCAVWLDKGKVLMVGDPQDVLDAYAKDIEDKGDD